MCKPPDLPKLHPEYPLGSRGYHRWLNETQTLMKQHYKKLQAPTTCCQIPLLRDGASKFCRNLGCNRVGCIDNQRKQKDA